MKWSDFLKNVREALNDEELRVLSLALNVNYSELRGENYLEKAQELYRYFERRARLEELRNVCKRKYPQLKWPDIHTTPLVLRTPSPQPSRKIEIEKTIVELEAKRALLGDALIDSALTSMRKELAELETAEESLADQRKYLTVLFADVSGFTAMSEKLDAEEVSHMMNTVWSRMDQVITSYGGYIDKHMGDAVMALFGAPVAQEDDEERAIHAALGMQAELKTIRQEQHFDLKLRIGINSGPAFLSKVGVTGEFTAIGDTVNVASRLEHAAPVGGILISDKTCRPVRGLFKVEPQEPIHVKGVTDPVYTFVVTGVYPHAFQAAQRGIEGIRVEMIGREAEMRVLKDAFYTCIEESRMQVCTITGEAGLGKSRLLHEYRNWLETNVPNAWFLKGRATMQIEQVPYGVLRHLFVTCFDIQDSDDTATARFKLEQGMIQLAETTHLEMVHFIGRLLGFDFTGSPYLRALGDDAEQVRNRATTYLNNLLQSISRKRPVIILIEDLQWADEASLDWLTMLMRTCASFPLFVVGLARPRLYRRRPHWGEGIPFHTKIDLHPLSKRDCHHLVKLILNQVRELPDSLNQFIVEKSEGNPYFIEELVNMLMDDGVILPGRDGWELDLSKLNEVHFPGTLEGILQARIDRLSPDLRQTLQQAAVVGRTFWDDAVLFLQKEGQPEGNLHQDELSQQLAALRQRGMIEMRPDSTIQGMREYSFKHAMLQEVTYKTVLLRKRPTYHAQIATWLLTHTGDRALEVAGLIAEHYEHAQEEALAGQWYVSAGEQSQRAYDPVTSVLHYEKALKLLGEEHPLCLGCYEGLGCMYMERAQFETATDAFQKMEEMAREQNDPLAQIRAKNHLASVHSKQGRYDTAMKTALSAEELARQTGAPAHLQLAAALYQQGTIASRLAQHAQAIALAREALSYSQDDSIKTGNVYGLLAVIHLAQGHLTEALHFQEQALGIFRKVGDQRNLVSGLNNQGAIAREMKDYPTAISAWEEALHAARSIGNLEYQMILLTNLGSARNKLGQFIAAEADLRRVLDRPESNSTPAIILTYQALTEALLGQQNFDEAKKTARRTFEIAQSQKHPRSWGMAWRTLAFVAAQTDFFVSPEELELNSKDGNPHILNVGKLDAAGCFMESSRVLAEAGLVTSQVRTLEEWADYEHARGNVSQAEALRTDIQAILNRTQSREKVTTQP